MKNVTPVLNRLEYIVEKENVYRNPGDAAVRAVKEIDEKFIVIARNTLPIVEKTKDPSVWGCGQDIHRVGGVTDQNSDPDFHRKRAKEHLAMAVHLIQKKEEKAEKLTAQRKKIWLELFPSAVATDSFSYEGQPTHVKLAIDKIVSLENTISTSAHF